MVITLCEALNTARTQGFFCTNSTATSVLAETIHIEASGPQIASVARLAVEAMLTVPSPESVESHSISDRRQIRVYAR